jgi:hypothetical protein
VTNFKGLLNRAAEAGLRLLGKEKPNPAVEEDLRSMQQAILLGTAMEHLTQNLGWKQMDKILELRLQVVFDQWTKSDPANLKQQVELQAEVRVLSEIREMPIRLVEDGQKAQAKLKELDDGSGERKAG